MIAYDDQRLSIVSETGCVNLASLTAADGGPFYVYDLDGLLARFKALREAFARPVSIHFAVKANNHPEILRALARAGAGADVVSEGEIRHSLECGFPGDKIVFSGVGKTKKEIRFALKAGVKQINVESVPELIRVADIARELKVKAPVALRMNPDVDANTHPYIRTGFRENKFGLDFAEMDALLGVLHNNSSVLELRGLTLHIGSQIREIAPFREAIEKTLRLHDVLTQKGFQLKTFDIGGGLGIDYHSADIAADLKLLQDYAATVNELTQGRDFEVLCEPGRFLVARFGALIGQVQYIKETPYKTFAILDTGMHHLMRPALYEAYHRILPLSQSTGDERLFDVVGPICESADVIGHERLLPAGLKEGDFLAIMDAGAYGAVMASTYNMRELPRQIVVSQGKVL